MALLLSLHKQWCDKILSGEKPIDFRTKLPKNLSQGDKIYLYETAKNNGCKKVVGECEVDYIIPVLSDNGKWPVYGAYPFIDYFYENIKKDIEIAELYRSLKREFGNSSIPYRYGFIIGYAFSEIELESLRTTRQLIDPMKVSNYFIISQVMKDNDKSKEYIEECDEWLSSIGYYNDSDESYYKYGIVLRNIKKYQEPKSLSDFRKNDGEKITTAPQSWMYCKTQ